MTAAARPTDGELWEVEVDATPGAVHAILTEDGIPVPGISPGGRLGITMAGGRDHMNRCFQAFGARAYNAVIGRARQS